MQSQLMNEPSIISNKPESMPRKREEIAYVCIVLPSSKSEQ